MEFVVTFLVCLAVLLLLVISLVFGRPPVYRPSREYVKELIETLLQGNYIQERWSLFVGLPIMHDPELEKIRQACYELELAAEDGTDICFGSGNQRYNQTGMAKLFEINNCLIKVIEETPISRDF